MGDRSTAGGVTAGSADQRAPWLAGAPAPLLHALGDKRFVLLCYELLRTEHPVEDVQYREGSDDLGCDLLHVRPDGTAIVGQCACYSSSVPVRKVREDLTKLIDNVIAVRIEYVPAEIVFYATSEPSAPAAHFLSDDRKWAELLSAALLRVDAAQATRFRDWNPRRRFVLPVDLAKRLDKIPDVRDRYISLRVIDGRTVGLAEAERLARDAARSIVAQWRSTYLVDRLDLVELELRERDRAAEPLSEPPTWTLSDAVSALADGRAIVLLGRPGAGKTITIVQCAEKALADGTTPVPLLLPASGWAATGRDLTRYVAERLAGTGLTLAHVQLLIGMRRIALLLNGWNEVAESDQARVNALLRDFLLASPGTPLVITTREIRNPPAVPGATLLDIRRLSTAQKLAIVGSAGLLDPDRVATDLATNPVLAELTDTPLFLSAALRLAREGRPIPGTRCELLGGFVDDLERTDEHADELATGACQGLHRAYLASVAAEMTKRGSTTISAAELQAALADCSATLGRRAHLGVPGATPAIADSLVRHHALVMPPGTSATYSFVHQQFQEWFAAQYLADQVGRLEAESDASGVFAFQRDVLNQPRWQEALALATERLVTDNELESAARIVRWTIPIDLIVAAELSGAAGPLVWHLVREELSAALRSWYARDAGAHRACALAAMLATSAPDFADLLWPILEGGEQDLMQLCRLHAPFPTRALGPEWRRRVADWPAVRQCVFLGEVSRGADEDVTEFAEARAAAGPALVRLAALAVLLERRAYARIVAVISAPGFGDWPVGLSRAILSWMPRPSVQPLTPILLKALGRATDPALRFGIIDGLQQVDDPAWVAAAQAGIESILVDWRADAATISRDSTDEPVRLLLSYAAMLQPVARDWLATWFVANMGHRFLGDERFIRIVIGFPERALTDVARSVSSEPSRWSRAWLRAVTAGVSAAAFSTVLDAYLASFEASDDVMCDRWTEQLKFALRDAPVATIVVGILAKATTVTRFSELKALIGLVSPSFVLDASLRDAVPPQQLDGFRAMLRRLSDLAPNNEEGQTLRPTLAVMYGALGHPDDVPLVAEWIATEEARWEENRQKRTAARLAGKRGRVDHITVSWWNWYGGALALFQRPAAEQILRQWLHSPYLIADGASGLVNFSVIERSLPALPPESAGSKQALQVPPPLPMGSRVRVRADAIVEALERFEQTPADDPAMRRRLADVAAALAALNDPRAIDRVLRLDGARDGWLIIRAFRAMSLRGTVLPGRRIAAALEPLFAKGEAPHSGSDGNPWHGVVSALALLLASDDPAVAIERMRRIPSHRMDSYCGRDVFELLASSDQAEAGSYLVELSKTMNESAPSAKDLVEALGRSSDQTCHSRVLELLLEGTNARTPGVWQSLEEAASHLATSNAAFLRELLTHVRDKEGDVGAALARVAGAIGTDAAVDAMLARRDLRPIESVLGRMIHDLAETKTPVGQSSAYYYVSPRDATELKRRLAALLVAGGPNGAVASRLLASLRAKRVQDGQPPYEPWHPDIEQLRPSGQRRPLLT